MAMLSAGCGYAGFALPAARADIAERSVAQSAGAWTSVGAMITPRSGHTATMLQNGKVLVAGGGLALASAELFDPVSLTWTSTGAMHTARFYHTATLLPNGKVLVAGGRTVLGGNAPDIASAELYDPSTQAWSITGSLNVAHTFHTATLLDTGEVLVVGAESSSTVEIYDPQKETWRIVGNYGAPAGVVQSSATLLSNGKVLVAGGCCPNSVRFAGASLFDPLTSTFSSTGALATPRVQHSATLLPDGGVLVTGGQDQGFNDISNPEVYDQGKATWSAAPGDTNKGALRAAVLLPSGEVLIVGGADTGAAVIYDSTTKQWSTAARMIQQRAKHTATLLSDGHVLVAGGGPANAELYVSDGSASDKWRPTIALATPVVLGESVGVEGNLFRGISEASNGSGSQNSATNYPVLMLRSADNAHMRLMLPDPVAGWTDTTFTSVPLTDFPTGSATLTVIVNGISGVPRSVVVQAKAASR